VQVRRTGALRWQGIDAQSIEVSLDTWYGGVAPACRWSMPPPTGAFWSSMAPATCAMRGTYPRVTVRFSAPPAQRPASSGNRHGRSH
jgi:hypothetical protein